MNRSRTSIVNQPTLVANAWVWPDGTTIPRVAGGDETGDPIVEILGAALDTFTTPEAWAERLATLTDEQLTALKEALEAGFAPFRESLASGEARPSADEVAQAQALSQGILAVRADGERRDGEAQALADQAAAIVAQVDGDGTEGDPAEGDGDAAPAEGDPAAPAEGEPAAPADPATPAEGDPAAPAEGEPAAEPQARAAAAAPVPLGRAQAQRPAANRRPAAARVGRIVGPNGQILRSLEEVGAAMAQRHGDLGASTSGVAENIRVARIEGHYPPSRQLDMRMDPDQLEAVLAAGNAEHLVALTAAANTLCAPPTPFYDQEVVGVTDRPGRDSLPQYQATRGGIRGVLPPTLADVDIAGADAAIGLYDPASPTTKPCMAVVCDDEYEVLIRAITRCLEFDTLPARYFPERVTAWTRLSLVAQARFAEALLINGMTALSTAVTTTEQLGATRDMLYNIGLGAVAMRDRERMGESAPLQAWFPFWVKELIRADLVRQLPGDGVGTMAVTDAQIAEWFRVRGIIPTFLLDGSAGASFGAQGVGALQAFPAEVEWLLFPAGTFTFLDGGAIDLGVVRDSVLNPQNKYQTFAETMENVAKTGALQSYAVTSGVCPSGASAGPVDPPVCTS